MLVRRPGVESKSKLGQHTPGPNPCQRRGSVHPGSSAESCPSFIIALLMALILSHHCHRHQWHTAVLLAPSVAQQQS